MASSSENMNEEKNPSSSINDGNSKCTCKKSKCVKFYCKCFNAGNFCNNSCSCKNCSNNEANKDGVEEIKEKILLHNPDAFESKIFARNRNGCNCSKSECKVHYCVCNRNRVGCSGSCVCLGCKNNYGIKGSSSQESPNHNNGSKNVVTMDYGSSSQSQLSENSDGRVDDELGNNNDELTYITHMPMPKYPVDDSQISENSDAREDDELGNGNVNNTHMPMPTNPVDCPYYNFGFHQNHVAEPYYHVPQTPVQINSITEMQSNNNLFGDPNWQEQSSFIWPPPDYYDDNVTEFSSIQMIQSSESSEQYQPYESHGFHQHVEASLGAITLQHPFLRSSQQPNHSDATIMQLCDVCLYPHHGHEPCSTTADYEENHHHRKFLYQNNSPLRIST